MRELSDEEKAELQAKIEEARTGGMSHQPEREVGNPRVNTIFLVVGLILLGLLTTLLQYATGLVIPLRVKWGIILLLMVAYVITKIGRKGRDE